MILVTRPSHNRAPGSETRETILIKHVSDLRAKDKLDNNVTTTMLILRCKIPANSNAHCKTIYWLLIIELQIFICRFEHCLRYGEFQLFIQVSGELCTWFFVFDHTDYSRWLPVHVKNLVMLLSVQPGIYNEFIAGNFVIHGLIVNCP